MAHPVHSTVVLMLHFAFITTLKYLPFARPTAFLVSFVLSHYHDLCYYFYSLEMMYYSKLLHLLEKPHRPRPLAELTGCYMLCWYRRGDITLLLL